MSGDPPPPSCPTDPSAPPLLLPTHLTALPFLPYSLSSQHPSGQNYVSCEGKAPEGPGAAFAHPPTSPPEGLGPAPAHPSCLPSLSAGGGLIKLTFWLMHQSCVVSVPEPMGGELEVPPRNLLGPHSLRDAGKSQAQKSL